VGSLELLRAFIENSPTCLDPEFNGSSCALHIVEFRITTHAYLGEYGIRSSELVREKLAYVSRFGLHEAIVKKFETRQAMRCKHKTSGMDKALNQLMVLTATSGAGKSTELVQFSTSCDRTHNEWKTKACERVVQARKIHRGLRPRKG
jgi:hypothetical protein